jgi:hypothetical protein
MGKYKTLHIKDELWKYKVGRQYIPIYGPQGQKYCPSCNEVSGLDWERAQWKGYAKMKPSMVKAWIEKKEAGLAIETINCYPFNKMLRNILWKLN